MRSLLLVACLAACLGAPVTLPAARVDAPSGSAKAVKTSAPRDFVQIPVAKMPDLLELVKAVKKGRLPERRLLLKLQTGGLAFELTDADLQNVAAAGATTRVLAALKGLKKPTPIKPDNRTGNLIVFCDPVDCKLTINGQSGGKTEHGKSQTFTFAEGAYAIRAAADDYVPDQPERQIALHSREQLSVFFKLQPTREALERAGRDLYGRVVAALGGTAALNSAKSFRASGSLQLSDRDGIQTAWGVQILSQNSDTTKFTFTRQTKIHTALQKNGQVSWDRPPVEIASIEDVLSRICQLQLPNLLARFSSPQFDFSADRLVPAAAGDNTFKVNGTPDSYVVTVDPLMHVKQIQVRSSGLNDGIKILYGDYTTGTGPNYPKVMQIVLPDRPRHGAEVDYSSLTYSPEGITERDFMLTRGKKKMKREHKLL